MWWHWTKNIRSDQNLFHPDMERKLEASDKFEVINNTSDTLALLTLICSITHKHDNIKEGTMTLVEHDLGFCTCCQCHHWTNYECYGMLKAAWDVMNIHCGRTRYNQVLYDDWLCKLKRLARISDGNQPTDNLRHQALNESYSEYLGCLFVCNACHRRYNA